MTAGSQIEVFLADYRDAAQAAAVVDLLNAYASEPAGGGVPLDPVVRQDLPAALAARPQACSVLACEGGQPVGLFAGAGPADRRAAFVSQ